MSLYPSSSRRTAPPPVGITEFEILKASHKFLRDEDEKPSTWDEQLAGKYYANLYREFAVCDLKHYKSGNFALRWRTEDEVLSGSGETTCGNTRCMHHFNVSVRAADDERTPLTTLELPFAYAEHGETKAALVKVVLCAKCVKKLMWKRTQERGEEKEKEREGGGEGEEGEREEKGDEEGGSSVRGVKREDEGDNSDKRERKKRSRRQNDKSEEKGEKRRRHRDRRSSRSRSPRRPSHPEKEKSSHRSERSSSRA